MKSLRQQVEEKLSNGRKTSAKVGAKSTIRKPLIVSPVAGPSSASQPNKKWVLADPRIDPGMEESSYPRVTRFETGKPGKVESISHSLKEESDVHLRQTWSQSALQEEPNLEEKSNFQLVDRILAQYGAHLGRQTGSKQYMEMAEYLSRYSEQQYASSGYKDRQMLAPTSRTTFRDRSGHTSFEQDPDCFPKAYVPIAHSIDDHQESQFNSSVKVRDVLKKAIRSGVKGSGQKSIANSSNSFIEQGSLFDRQRVKEILIQQKAINLYHRDISQDNRSMVSRNKSEERYQKDSDYGFDSSHYDEVSEKFSEDEASRQAATADSRYGVPVFTCKSS